MCRIIAVLFEERKEDSYIAVELEGTEREILFMKGPAFVKTMGPFPPAYARATFEKWNYCRVENPPVVSLSDTSTLAATMMQLTRSGDNKAVYRPDTA